MVQQEENQQNYHFIQDSDDDPFPSEIPEFAKDWYVQAE